LEIFYRIGFAIVSSFKKHFGGHKVFYKIISVGNLSVGGTGKSVFVQFLVRNLQKHLGAIFLRGYGRKGESNKSILLDFEAESHRDVRVVGDEAMMFLQNLSIPVVVGKNRILSSKILDEFCREKGKKIDYVVLDDAYQNHQLKKDLEILLIDAQGPFGNGHCLPAGPMREKDFGRASMIILTHADEVDSKELENLKKFLSQNFDFTKIFSGKHFCAGIRQGGIHKISSLEDKQMFVVAGIGLFSGFINSLKKRNVIIKRFKKYIDHHDYSKADVQDILLQMHKSGCDGIVTTQKDWQKIKELTEDKDKFFVFEVGFEFLSDSEKREFFKEVEKVLN
jgi:tetraacyldisaccharide 4'-kinase